MADNRIIIHVVCCMLNLFYSLNYRLRPIGEFVNPSSWSALGVHFLEVYSTIAKRPRPRAADLSLDRSLEIVKRHAPKLLSCMPYLLNLPETYVHVRDEFVSKVANDDWLDLDAYCHFVIFFFEKLFLSVLWGRVMIDLRQQELDKKITSIEVGCRKSAPVKAIVEAIRRVLHWKEDTTIVLESVLAHGLSCLWAVHFYVYEDCKPAQVPEDHRNCSAEKHIYYQFKDF